MLGKLFLLFFLLSPVRLWAQKDNLVKTDSSMIETKYFKYLNSIRVFNKLKNKNKSYYTDYYYNTKGVREKGVFLNNNYYGIWKEFWPNGKLKRETDYN